MSWIAAQEGQTQTRGKGQALTPFSHSADTSPSDKKAPRAASLLFQTHNNGNKKGVLQHKESMGNFMPSCFKKSLIKFIKTVLSKAVPCQSTGWYFFSQSKEHTALTARICHPSNTSGQGEEMAKERRLKLWGKKKTKKKPFQPTMAKINLNRLAHSLFKSFLFSPSQS